MKTFAEIIAAWGDDAVFAEEVGAPRSLVAVWKHRNSIPAPYWSGVLASAEKRGIEGVTVDVLAKLSRRQRRASSAEVAA